MADMLMDVDEGLVVAITEGKQVPSIATPLQLPGLERWYLPGVRGHGMVLRHHWPSCPTTWTSPPPVTVHPRTLRFGLGNVSPPTASP